MFQDPLISPPCYFLILSFNTNTLFRFYQVCTLIINRFHSLILYCTFFRITILELKIWCYFIKQKTATNSLRSHFLLISNPILLPFYRCRRFARDVVDDAIDVRYFVDDTGADGLQDFPRDASEVTRHAVDTRYGTDSNRVVVRSAVTHYSNAADAW